MNNIRSTSVLSSLAGALLAILGLGHAGAASAATIPVTNCLDHGPGSLRNAVKIAASADTIDLRSLDCSSIVLTSGEIVIPQADLALVGAGASRVVVDANRPRTLAGRAFLHTGKGTLRISSMSIARGWVKSEDPVSGGCISSMGSVELRRARVFSCVADSYNPESNANSGSGGGISASSVLLWHSSVYDNQGSGIGGAGGGIATGTLTLYHAQLFGNGNNDGGGAVTTNLIATSSVIRDNSGGYSGGITVYGNATIQKSTISGNRAVYDVCGAGLCVRGLGVSRLVDSTISGNYSEDGEVSGASFVDGVAIFNSTIASNLGLSGCSGLRAHRLHVESSIIASNTCLVGPGVDLGGNPALDTVIGAHNLIGSSTLALPAGTLHGDPRLAPLADNGGPTPTHALRADSPAIGRGSNVLGLKYDQRGAGHPRVRGHCADIGAFER